MVTDGWRSTRFRIGDRWVEPALCRIVRPGATVHVEPRAMDVLVALARHAGATASRDDLIREVWRHPNVTDEALSRCISLLRQALGDDRRRPSFVETIPKRGYRLIARVECDQVSHVAPTSLAVLPFLNLSADAADDYLADGVTELLISNLACVPLLRVVSRTSSMHYKGSSARLRQIAHDLDVERIVEGSVLRGPDQLQVVVQLIDAETDTHVLTRTYTRRVGDMLQLQNEIASTMAGEIGASLGQA